MPKTGKNPHPRSNAPKFPGITEHAEALGVTRTHLFLVLTGKRQSKRLSTAYARLTRAA
jgi:hypothetical protein